MAAIPLLRLQINISNPLPAGSVGLLSQVVVSSRSVRVHEVRTGAVGGVAGVVLDECESGFEKISAGEVVLIFYGGHVGGLVVLGIGGLGTLRGKECVLVVEVIDEEAGGENVAVGEIGLELGEIAEAKDVVVVGSAGQFGIDLVVVFAVEGIVEPDFPLCDGAGKGEARKKLIEAPSVAVDERGEEVGGGEAEMVVADAGVEHEQSGGAFTGFGGLAGRFDLDRAEGVGADAEQEQSVGRWGYVEAIEQSFGLISLSSGDVGLAELILHDARNEVENITEIVGGGENDVDDVESGEGLARRNLRGINGGSGFADVDDFTNLLLVVESDLDG